MLAILINSQTVSQFFKHFHIQKTQPTLPLLTKITEAFSHIPYENVTKILKKVEGHISEKTFSLFRLPQELLEDYLEHGTGGTCFSLTFFLHQICKECGFISYPAMADRSYGENMHCALVVFVDKQKYLADPGFLIDRPIPLDPTRETRVATKFNVLSVISDPKQETYDVYTVQEGGTKVAVSFKRKAGFMG